MENSKLKRRWIVMAMAITILLAIDQMAKSYSSIYATQGHALLLGVFHITYIRNTGVALGIAGNNPFLAIIMQLVVLTFVVQFLRLQYTRMNLGTKIALTFILAGGTSNLVDRILYRAVIDYIDISPILPHFPVFNLADTYIVVGLLLFIISFAVYGVTQAKKEEREKERKLKWKNNG